MRRRMALRLRQGRRYVTRPPAEASRPSIQRLLTLRGSGSGRTCCGRATLEVTEADVAELRQDFCSRLAEQVCPKLLAREALTQTSGTASPLISSAILVRRATVSSSNARFPSSSMKRAIAPVSSLDQSAIRIVTRFVGFVKDSISSLLTHIPVHCKS
jgi:hypothetical protein